MKTRIIRFPALSLAVLAILVTLKVPLSTLRAQGTAFAYQGRLNDGSNLANGVYDLRFAIYDSGNSSGNLIAGPVTNSAIAVSDGLFTVALDFGGGVFDGNARWLEIAVRTNGATSFTTLTPRQLLTPTPYAILAGTASGLVGLLPMSQVSGVVPLAQLPGAVLTNGQVGSVALNGSLVLSATATLADTIYSGSSTLLRADNNQNFFSGVGAGNLALSGAANVGVGSGALANDTSGSFNSAIGYQALLNNTNGIYNTAIGNLALDSNTSGSYNIALGHQAGYSLTAGSYNIDIGNMGVPGESSTIRLGTPGVQTNTFIAGIFGKAVAAGTPVYVDSTGLLGTGAGSPVALLGANQTFTGVVSFNNAADSFTGNGSGLTTLNASQLNSGTVPAAALSNAWQTTGNAGTTAGANFIGTTDGQPLEFKVNNVRAFRLETTNDADHTGIFNVLGGAPLNYMAPGVCGSVIAGGGAVNYYGAAWTNSVSADLSFLGGGRDNAIQMNADSSFLGGGMGNSIQTNDYQSFLGGGSGNLIQANAAGSVLVGGIHNSIQTNSSNSFLGGGNYNLIQANGWESFLGGGTYNSIQAYAWGSFLGGGNNNSIQGDAWKSFLGGGNNNLIQANAWGSFLGGGSDNSIQVMAAYSFLGGGAENFIQPGAAYAFLGGGASNVVSGSGAVVGGGGYDGANIVGNTASGVASVVVGGTQNIASGSRSTVGGGHNNSATNWYATVPGGAWNIAGGEGSFAAGRGAKALHDGSLVWNDDASGDLSSMTANSVSMRASGGYRLYSSGSAGVSLAAGSGSWTSLSDRNAKENFAPVDVAAALQKVAALPLTTWNYKSQDAAIRHIGPMAQDFKAAFAVGESGTGITTIDADGVALAAIQGLNQKLETETKRKDAQIREQSAEITELRQSVTELKVIVQSLAARK